MTAVRLAVHPGHGVVARWGRYALAVMAPADHVAAMALVELVRSAAAAEAGGQALLQRLAAHLAAADDDPTFAVVGPHEDRWVALVHGPATLRAEAPDGPVELTGAGRPTWADGYLPAATTAIEVHADDAEPASVLFGFDLVEGVVPGAGFLLRADQPAPPAAAAPDEAAAEEPPTEERAVAEPPVEVRPAALDESAEVEAPADVEGAVFVRIDVTDTGDVAPRRPLAVERADTRPEPVGSSGDLVTGINCKRGHFNHPQAAYCALCGISMLQQTQNPVQGVRPPLGILVFGDGMTLSVDGAYVIGREPERDPEVAGGAIRSFALDDPDQVLSRVHLRVGARGWDVEVTDRDSANGTYVRVEGGSWRRLEPGDPHVLESGSQVRLGNHQFVYEAHHRPRGAEGR